ncbi:DUF362 domain-containing protein [Opitutus terrae]|nr:DUF362 domain-containing protein [Opitutus terrae]
MNQSVCTAAALALGLIVAAVRASGNDAGLPRFATASAEVNRPIGAAKGIFRGRVVWVHEPAAVNQACVADAAPGWYARANNEQPVVDGMVSRALQTLTGESTDAAAWAAIFRFHNATRGKGAASYVRGEKVVIKINATSAYHGNFDPVTLRPRMFISETSVGPVLAMLRQLVNVVGVDQRDIYVGDPMKHIYPHLYAVWHGEFPDVHYLDNGGYTALGRETAAPSATATLHYSDRGSVLRTNVWANNYPGDNPVTEDRVYAVFDEAEYLINITMLKGHKRAGVTMFAKNHFGSHTRGDASHLHNGLVAPTEMPNATREGYGLYRVQVDIMGHASLGRKNLLFLMDALWAADHELGVPLRWQMPPFANTYMASIFASLDPVAIESVGYDFLRSEFTTDRVPLAGTFVQMTGVDDYLHQAADSANWPAGLGYDPNGTGVPLASLGVHEHWDSAATKRYSRNLSAAGTGIELVRVSQSAAPGRLANISTRAQCGTDANVTIGGFVITGAAKQVLIRAVGPSLEAQGMARAALLADPLIELHEATRSEVVASNDDWTTNPNAAAIVSTGAELGAAALSSDDTTSSALLLTLPRGVYSIVVRGQAESSGIVLVEIYDADPAGAPGRLANLSTRARCGTGDNVTIGGFVVTGGPKQVLIRAVGPTLATRGLNAFEVLFDPTIELHDARRQNRIVATNDNNADGPYPAELPRIAGALGAGALDANDRRSATLLTTLAPGVYSVVTRGRAATEGVVLIEVFDAD